MWLFSLSGLIRGNPHQNRVRFLELRVDRELLKLSRFAIPLAKFCLAVPFPVHSTCTAARSEVLVGHDTSVRFDDLVDHALPPRDVLGYSVVGRRANDRPRLLHEVPHLLWRALVEDPPWVAVRVNPRQGAVEAHGVLEISESVRVKTTGVLWAVARGSVFVQSASTRRTHWANEALLVTGSGLLDVSLNLGLVPR